MEVKAVAGVSLLEKKEEGWQVVKAKRLWLGTTLRPDRVARPQEVQRRLLYPRRMKGHGSILKCRL